MKAQRKTKVPREPGAGREYRDADHDLTGRKKHTFRDPGPPIVVGDWKPAVIHTDPVQDLALIFALLGRDYGGSLPADFVLHAVLQSGRP